MYDFAWDGRLSTDVGDRISVMMLGRYNNDDPLAGGTGNDASASF